MARVRPRRIRTISDRLDNGHYRADAPNTGGSSHRWEYGKLYNGKRGAGDAPHPDGGTTFWSKDGRKRTGDKRKQGDSRYFYDPNFDWNDAINHAFGAPVGPDLSGANAAIDEFRQFLRFQYVEEMHHFAISKCGNNGQEAIFNIFHYYSQSHGEEGDADQGWPAMFVQIFDKAIQEVLEGVEPDPGEYYDENYPFIMNEMDNATGHSDAVYIILSDCTEEAIEFILAAAISLGARLLAAQQAYFGRSAAMEALQQSLDWGLDADRSDVERIKKMNATDLLDYERNNDRAREPNNRKALQSRRSKLRFQRIAKVARRVVLKR